MSTERTFRLMLPMKRFHNPNQRGQHWAMVAAKRREMREGARTEAVKRGLEPIKGTASLTVTFEFPDRRPRDLDNYEIKGAIDGAVDAGLITDDRSTVLFPITRRPSEHKSPKGFAVLTFTFTPHSEKGDEVGQKCGHCGRIGGVVQAPEIRPGGAA